MSYADLADLLGALPLLLRDARRARGLSQRAAGAQIGGSYSTVCRIEAGEGCSLYSAVAVLRWLGATAGGVRVPANLDHDA